MLDTLELYTRVYDHLVSFDDLLAQYTQSAVNFLEKVKIQPLFIPLQKSHQCTKHYVWYIDYYLDTIAIA